MIEDVDVARAAAQAGAEELTARYRVGGVRETATAKSTHRDLVTDADRAAETAVLDVIRRAFPDDAIVAEESAAHAATGRRTWIVDPLDGTVNFAHGIPVFCVSVGLVVDGVPTVGVIDAPLLDERYEGVAGRHALLNGERIHVSDTPDLADALLATGFAYDIENLRDDNFDNLTRIAKRARGIRRLGSAALDLAWTAAGRFDAYWEIHCSAWDVAAGAALVVAAGGRVTDMTGGADFLFGRHLVASNGCVHDALLATLVRPSFAHRRD